MACGRAGAPGLGCAAASLRRIIKGAVREEKAVACGRAGVPGLGRAASARRPITR
jgi:hypothetical protein